ncbi:MAG: integration host factor subunit alpha [Candidatus Dadabacteria bacterium]|nr:integration host factor subunit alpha [Candidatus Dadabacteria bacterium]NIQ16607.1 integration host factor subunit alpha [Candidatus Dadabacteria bacterium]
MTKKELSDTLHTKIGLSKRESAEIVDYFFNLLKDNLSDGKGVKLPRFGSFRVQERKSRKGRNPSTGETIEISSRKAVVFKPSRFLRDAIDTKVIE